MVVGGVAVRGGSGRVGAVLFFLSKDGQDEGERDEGNRRSHWVAQEDVPDPVRGMSDQLGKHWRPSTPFI